MSHLTNMGRFIGIVLCHLTVGQTSKPNLFDDQQPCPLDNHDTETKFLAYQQDGTLISRQFKKGTLRIKLTLYPSKNK